MVIYDLICANFHGFEGWFKDSEDFKAQQKSGLIACPACDDAEIKMKPSKVAILGKKSNQVTKQPMPAAVHQQQGAPVQGGSSSTSENSSGTSENNGGSQENSGGSNAMHFNSPEEQMTVLRDFVEKNFEDVGNDFSEEVRKMHYGETDQRGIRGNASKEEVESLADEGIDTFAIPVNSVDKKKLN